MYAFSVPATQFCPLSHKVVRENMNERSGCVLITLYLNNEMVFCQILCVTKYYKIL